MTLPNFITIARLLAVPLIVWLVIEERYTACLVLFILAGISDALDGFLAKQFGWSSVLGSYLDPIADKALLVSVFLSLGTRGAIPAWLIVLVVSRDILIVGAVVLASILGRPIKMKPLWVSKFNTAAQIVLVATSLALKAGTHDLAPVVQSLVIVVAGLTVGSAGAYLVDWVRHMAGVDEQSKEPGA
ncbi:cardiolipin synthase [Faunimonas pinastri]|uniref:CDP-diacylglycerol--glycerol-3-phosphate 3-phosphatidyltransferase n=1 Tax=Faunimonas pinastri TaxID=1855383 RepID=A0A1H9CBX6_9HYPH|nr:CDP-alcohol phosphatidyltransferase family protein [Faunimonas pinastri]SEP98293.1 cardiolipin synthase [Faunimonas pinastri]